MGLGEDIREGLRPLTKPFRDYAAMMDAYDAAFGVEKEEYPEQPDLDMDEDDFDEDADAAEILAEAYEAFNMEDPVRFYGDAFRAVYDEDREALQEEVKDYAGDGLQGGLFTFFALEERYDVAAAVIGEDPEQVEDDVAPLVEEYHALPEERYGVQLQQRLDDDHEEHLDTAMEVLSPLIAAYRNGGDAGKMLTAVGDVLDEADEHFDAPADYDETEPIDIGHLVHDDDALDDTDEE